MPRPSGWGAINELQADRHLAEPPFAHLDRVGLLVTVNSDDPPLFNTPLSPEYQVLAEEFGYSPHDLVRVARRAFTVCVAEAEVKERLLARFDAWVGGMRTLCQSKSLRE